MSFNGAYWSCSVDLSQEHGELEYKYILMSEEEGHLPVFEPKENRILKIQSNLHPVQLNDAADFSKQAWKRAGVNVQLSSLRTKQSWGVGDFSDLKLLVDWSAEAGISMIQLLPINDTIATQTQKDSYPYSAISAFAQHPVFLDIRKMAKSCKFKIPKSSEQKARDLNEQQSLDYVSATSLKLEVAQLVYEKHGESILKSSEFQIFFDTHGHWLKPYAVFSVLRDKYQTADYSKWEILSVYEVHELNDFADEEGPHFSKIGFYYFLQYHLHLQLTDAVSYAHRNKIIIKGDLPIGVGRHSVDTWMNPHLFHLEMQAGAPPDAFATKGQNWSFPTYNWEIMKKDHYTWWRLRLQHMQHYFDATRIDHVLGFFRIWSIPVNAVEGILGYFVPALALYEQDFKNAGVYFDENRLCEPFITDDIIQQRFGEHAQWVRQQVLTQGRFKESCDNQRKLETFFNEHPEKSHLKQPLFDLLSEVILLRDEYSPGHFHFRIEMQQTESFRRLPQHEQHKLNALYNDYYYSKQNELWYHVAVQKLDAIQQSSDMMICAEDLGMVPDMVEGVLSSRKMLALQVERMPKKSNEKFSLPAHAPYLSVVTPSTHDMSTIRQWWEEDRGVTQDFFTYVMHEIGTAPGFAEPWICEHIVNDHLQSPAMWSVFLLQDLLSVNANLRRENPHDERINIPADPNHYWNYRMHVNIEELIAAHAFNQQLKLMMQKSGRA
jgi:4-alpha-glucanotransferase